MAGMKRRRGSLAAVAILAGLGLCSCVGGFSVDRRGGIVRYNSRTHTASTAQKSLQAGILPDEWSGPKLQLKQLVYHNDDIGGTIVADALCGPKFNDAPLPRLAADLFASIGNAKNGKGRKLVVDGRDAYRLTGAGQVDGVPVMMDAVVYKKNYCLVDAVYFAPPETFGRGISDFEGYFHGLRLHEE